MKKFLIALTALLMLTVSAFAATPTNLTATPSNLQNPQPVSVLPDTLVGFVTAVTEDLLTMTASDGVIYEVHLPDDTICHGKDAMDVGDWVYVKYNGIVTRSIPAQVTAYSVACYFSTGVVANLTDEGFQLLPATEEAATEDTADVSAPDAVLYDVAADAALLTDVKEGMVVTVFFNGASTASLPAKIFAEFIRLPALNGTIDELTEDGFLMTDADGVAWAVVVDSESTLMFEEPAVGIAVSVTWNGNATRSIPAQIVAAEVLPFYGVEAIAQ